jgi:hypothetical protein
MSAPGNVSYVLLDGELNAYPTLKHTTASMAQALPRAIISRVQYTCFCTFQRGRTIGIVCDRGSWPCLTIEYALQNDEIGGGGYGTPFGLGGAFARALKAPQGILKP